MEAWKDYARQASREGVLPTLGQKLVQLRFPVREGISRTQEYRAAIRRGERTEPGEGVRLQSPDELGLLLQPTPAGVVPVLIAGCREDFVLLVQALGHGNEPVTIPDSMGAITLGGLKNWDRIERLKLRFEREFPAGEWDEEFARMLPYPELYQDRVLIVSTGEYSGVEASALGIEEPAWRELSLAIRLHHECAHYFTHRVLGSMQNHALDELIADYMGIRGAIGRYRADWALHFLGLESFPNYRRGGRLQNYRDPPLRRAAFSVVCSLVRAAVGHLESFDSQLDRGAGDASLLLTLTRFGLIELASPEAPRRLVENWSRTVTLSGCKQ
ncbi:MAG: hypothetical protein HY319_19265 [Armatimonadetes bacterium]|nr:hypothetical protein [Armatimonadota bacterium]